ncbi:MAG: hypothetical protein LAO21_23180 [Acidobacteriia bacterium]|nr:hypothetical protein [Terriglobia bacterium]
MGAILIAHTDRDQFSSHIPLILLALTALAVLAYLPVFSFPFISDDFVQIPLARQYGNITGWAQLAHDPGSRYRATYFLLSYGLDHIFGFRPLPFYIASVSLHVLCVWLVFALGAWDVIGWRVSALSASFFAIYEGHQEAVMWVAASMELLLFLFGFMCLLAWVLWLKNRHWWIYGAALVSFFVTLFSKESSWIIVPLMLLPVLTARPNWQRGIIGLIPFGGTALAYVIWIMGTRTSNPRFRDGSFSSSAPWLLTLTNSSWRVLFVWGIISLAALLFWKAREFRTLSIVALIWILLGLLPYSFLTYMSKVPSRHTYLASVGLAWIVAAALVKMHENAPRWLSIVVVVLILLHNIGILWVKKRAQFLERAAPTQKLMEIAAIAKGPLYLHCFPYASVVAEYAVRPTGHELIIDPKPIPGPDCFSVTFSDKQGNVHTYTWKR